MRLPFVLTALVLTACSASHADGADAGASRDGGGRTPTDAGLVLMRDAALPDAALPDAAMDAPIDAPVDRGPDGAIGTGLVECGATECVAPGEACRATCESGGSPAPACIDTPEGWETGECPGGGADFPTVVARCDGPEDCGSDACLVLLGSIGNYPQCACHDAPDGSCISRSSFALCHDVSDCPSWATACEPNSELLRGFYRTCVE
jgi:hypothetical protein